MGKMGCEVSRPTVGARIDGRAAQGDVRRAASRACGWSRAETPT